MAGSGSLSSGSAKDGEIESIESGLKLNFLNRDCLKILQNSSQKLETTAVELCQFVNLYLPPFKGPPSTSLSRSTLLTDTNPIPISSANGGNIHLSTQPEPLPSFLYYNFACELATLIEYCVNSTRTSNFDRQNSQAPTPLLTNSEYLLFRITSAQAHPDDGKIEMSIGMFQLPYLPHWIECIDVSKENASTRAKVMGELAKGFLGGTAQDFAPLTPGDLVRMSSRYSPDTFDTAPYRAILARIGVNGETESHVGLQDHGPAMVSQVLASLYLDHSEASFPQVSLEVPNISILTVLASRRSGPKSLPRFSLGLIREFVGQDPTDAAWAITHLSVDLASVELIGQLTEPATEAIFLNAGIDVSQIVRDFIQHSLRGLEGITTLSEEETNLFHSVETQSTSLVGAYSPDLSNVAYTISLLSLLIVSVVSRKLMTAQELLWETRELFYRYPWVPEVRTLREVYSKTDIEAA